MRSIKLTVGMEPLEIVTWKDAIKLYFENKVNILWVYPDRKLHSPNKEWDWPSIISLKYSVDRRPERDINPSTRSILIRDLYMCQYCGCKLTNSSGTKDHVIPESRKGPSTWDNLVASCRTCQDKKADRMPEDCGMFPKIKPRSPTLQEKFKNNIIIANSYERRNWRMGLKKLGLDYLLEDIKDD